MPLYPLLIPLQRSLLPHSAPAKRRHQQKRRSLRHQRPVAGPRIHGNGNHGRLPVPCLGCREILFGAAYAFAEGRWGRLIQYPDAGTRPFRHVDPIQTGIFVLCPRRKHPHLAWRQWGGLDPLSFEFLEPGRVGRILAPIFVPVDVRVFRRMPARTKGRILRRTPSLRSGCQPMGCLSNGFHYSNETGIPEISGVPVFH